MKQYFYVYILSNKPNGVLYIGVTGDLAKRVWEHKTSQNKGFTQKYNVHDLVYVERFDYIDKAIEREKCLKRWKRDWKIELIKKQNPTWQDLYGELNNWL